MDRLLCTCPSRGRPKLLDTMIRSFKETASDSTYLVIQIDDDDENMKEYYSIRLRERGDESRISFHIAPRQDVAQIHNSIVRNNPDFDYYMPVNDDIVFQTPGWDKVLINTIQTKGSGWGISYGNDLGGNYTFNLPTFGVMSANLVRVLGSFYPTELKMMFGDTFLLDLGRAIGRLYYCPDVIIEHKPPGHGAGAFVPGDTRGKEAFYRTEQRAYSKYIDTRFENDVARVFDAIVNQDKVKVML